jgi:hypothetical protein
VPGMGPPPNENRARRNATVAMTALPAEGRKGDLPDWPLLPDVVLRTRADLAEAKAEELRYELNEALDVGKPVARIETRLDKALETAAIMAAQVREQRHLEDTLWAELWTTPQACEWERLRWHRDVAQYVRHKVMAELGDLDGAREARQWSDRLGLNPLALLRLRWKVAADEVAEKRAERTSSARGRIKAV